ncbi:hypothetical protein ACFY8O_34350 [Streptomyces argenteolus]|uniref:Uncharacterized protein n=1 Tax=Streptomyces argenteolus TaxID=67274 RepID=A0ABW6XGT0_9ACTN
MTDQPYAVRISAQAAKVLAELPDQAEGTVWDVLDAAAANPWGFTQWDADGPEGEGIRIASIDQLSVIFFANRTLCHLSVLDIVGLGRRVTQRTPVADGRIFHWWQHESEETLPGLPPHPPDSRCSRGQSEVNHPFSLHTNVQGSGAPLLDNVHDLHVLLRWDTSEPRQVNFTHVLQPLMRGEATAME